MLLYAKKFYERLIMKKILLTLFILFFSTTSALALSVEHSFSVHIGVFDASRTTFHYSLTPNTYKVNSIVSTNGFFNSLYPFKAEYSSQGQINADKLKTQKYYYQSHSRFNTRHKELIYNNKGEPIYRISSKNGKEKKVEIEPQTNNSGTTDLQTVIAELALQYNRLNFCAARMEVFDGKRRYDVIFKDEGQDELPTHPLSPYSGTAAKCSMYIDKLSSQSDDLLWELTQDRPIYFWIMRDKQTQAPFIARISIKETPLGKLEVYTTQIKIKED